MGAGGRQVWIQRARWALLGALSLFVAALAGLYVVSRARQVGLAPPPAAEAAPAGEHLLAGRKFDYEVTREGKTILRVQGERMLSDRNENVRLEGMTVILFRDDGSRYELRGPVGTYNRKTQETDLAGEAELAGPNGLRLSTEGLRLSKGQVLTSDSPVRYAFGGLAGRADGLSVNLRRNLYLLRGDVRAASLPGSAPAVSLRCDRLSFERDRHMVRAVGKVDLRRGEDALATRRLSLQLTEDERGIEFLHAQWGVEGRFSRLAAEGWGQEIALRGDELSATMDAETGAPKQVELHEKDRRSAALESRDASGLARRVAAPYVLARFEAGALREVEASGPVLLRESLVADPRTVIRLACAEQAAARFGEAGDWVSATLEGGVDLWQSGSHASGDRADIGQGGDAMDLRGGPARLLSRRGELEAPRIEQFSSGEVRAEDGVWARVGEASTVSWAGARGPVELESAEALWRDSPESVLFRGDVHARQGEDLLFAAELEGFPEEERVVARGGVKTVLRRTVGGAGGGAGPTEPLEVTADELAYGMKARRATYSGGARAHQGARSLRCEQIDLGLAEGGRVDTVTCSGKVLLEDTLADQTVEGDAAVYEVASALVTVTGERVILKDRAGKVIEGPALVYDFEAGTARIQGRDVLEPLEVPGGRR